MCFKMKKIKEKSWLKVHLQTDTQKDKKLRKGNAGDGEACSGGNREEKDSD